MITNTFLKISGSGPRCTDIQRSCSSTKPDH